MLAVVVIKIFFGAIVRIDVGVACYADNACALGGVHREHFINDGFDSVFQKDVLSAFTRQLDYALCLMGQRNKAERSIVGANVLALLFALALSCFGFCATLFVADQARKNVQCTVFQVREGVTRIDDLRRKVGNNAFFQVLAKILRLFGRKVFGLKLADAAFGQLTHDLVVDAFFLRVQLMAALIDCLELFVGRHLRFVVAQVFVYQRKIGKAANAYHEELLQVAAEDGHEGEAFEQGNVMVFALIEYTLVEFEPRKLTVLHIGQNVMTLMFGMCFRGSRYTNTGILFRFHDFPSILFPRLMAHAPVLSRNYCNR